MRQTRLLARTFFARMFESDLMPEGLPQVQLVLWSVLLAATPATGYAILLPDKYQSAQLLGPLATEFHVDRIILITLSMVAMGVVGLIIWDGVFPDRRDVRILGVLPIPQRCLVISRLAALGQVYVMFAIAICVLQSIIVGLVVAGFGGPVSRVNGSLSHLVAVATACTFVFASLIAAQCLLLLLFGRRAAQGASVAFQVLFAVGLVQLLVFLGMIGDVLRRGGHSHDGISALTILPPTWFFGLYETVSGTGGTTEAALARLAVYATIASIVLAVGLYGLSYSHLSRRTLEGPMPYRVRLPRWPRAHAAYTPRRGFNSPLRRAIRQFAVRTLIRSRSHRMMFALYGGVSLAIVLSSVASVAMRNDGPGFWQPGMSMLYLPLVFQFFLLVAIRVIIAVPSEPKARWVFRACEPADRGEAVSAIHDAMVTVVILPTTLLALAEGLIFWSVPTALGHATFCLLVGMVFGEILLRRTNKLPFACTYFPGKSKVFTLWPLYLIVFFLYTVLLAAIEGALLARPGKFLMFCLAAMLAHALLVWSRSRSLAGVPGLLFEEEDPDAIFDGFHLSEGLAAAPKTSTGALASANLAPTPGGDVLP